MSDPIVSPFRSSRSSLPKLSATPIQRGTVVAGLERTALVVTCLAPCIIFYLLIGPLFLKVPFVDDFDAILNFVLEADKVETWREKLTLAFGQHNEHRIALLRLSALFQRMFWGHVDLIALSWTAAVLCSAFAGAVVLFLLRQSYERRNNARAMWLPLAALPVTLLVFQPSGFEGFLWPTVSLGSAAVILAGWLAAVLLTEPSWLRLIGGLLCLALGVFSLGNGLALYPALLVSLLLYRRFFWASVWTLGGALVCATYFYGYYSPPGHPSVVESLNHVPRNVLYCLYFIGSALSFGNSWLALLWGISVSGWVGWLTWRRGSLIPFPVYAFLIFLLGSVASNALARSEFGVTYALTQNRYQFLSCLVLSFSALSFVYYTILEKKNWFWWSMPLLFFLLWSHLHFYRNTFPQLVAQSTQVHQGFRQWLVTGAGLRYPWPDRSNDIMIRAIDTGVYPLGERERKRLGRRRAGDSAL